MNHIALFGTALSGASSFYFGTLLGEGLTNTDGLKLLLGLVGFSISISIVTVCVFYSNNKMKKKKVRR